MKDLWKRAAPYILWGSLWGLTEATAGYVLHLLPKGIGWLFWFPIAFYFMLKAYRKTGKAYAILIVSGIAAGIKLLDLLLPVRVDKVINPSVSILLEALAVYFVTIIIKRRETLRRFALPYSLAVNTLWRAGYLLYIAFMPQWMREISPLAGMQPMIKLMVTENLITSALIYLYLRIEEPVGGRLHRLIEKWQPSFNRQSGWKLNILKPAAFITVVVLNLALHFI